MNAIPMLAACLSALGLAGCEIAASVKAAGAYEGLTNSDPDKGTIFVYRDKSFTGITNQYDVMLNGVLVGSLPNGSFISVVADPGEARVEPRTLTSFGFGKGSVVTVEKGKTQCLKLTLNFCMQCKSASINPVGDEQCESEIRSLERVVLK